MDSWYDFKKALIASEGEVAHMYLDTVGAVTVGVGNLLSSLASAQNLGFVNRRSLKPATKEEIEADYHAVKKAPKGLKASFYRQYTKLDLPKADIDKLLDSRIDEIRRQLKRTFPKFDRYPATAQFALADMAFNVGSHGLVMKFPKFKKAVDTEDWAKAAKESNRPQVSASRNAEVRRWLDKASSTQSATIGVSPTPQPQR